MDLQQQRAGLLAGAVFRAWQGAGVRFLVLRNYEGLPVVVGNDVDVLIESVQLDRAETRLRDAARTVGFRLHNRAEFAGTAALYLSDESNAQVHFDLITAFKWRGLRFLEGGPFFECQRTHNAFAIPRPAHEAASTLLEKLLHTGGIEEKYRARIALAFRTEAEAATTLLAATYGSRVARLMVAAAAREDWAVVQNSVGALRRALWLRELLRQPLRTGRSLVAEAGRLAGRLRRPPGLAVVLCGADGSGKSTVATGLVEGLARTFSHQAGRRFHWKPPVFSGRRHAARAPVTAPHGQAPRAAWLSLLFFAGHWLEFWLGWFLRVRPALFRGGMVVIDRFYYDFFVDQRRYRLRVPDRVVRLGYCLLAKPDLVLILDAPTDELRSRKQEVPAAETERQRRAYLELVSRLDNGRVVSTAQTPAQAASAAVRATLDFLADRARRRGD